MSASHSVLPELRLLSMGAAGLVFQVTPQIALKHARIKGSERIEHENRIFELLETNPPCPHIISSFLRLPDHNFLEYMAGGNLEDRLRARQSRGSTGEVITVLSLEPTDLVLRWMRELTGATAWLESLGLVHGDIRPANLLLSSENHLKLSDFDSAAKLGDISEGGAPPYARLQGAEAGSGNSTFGLVGARTEQFAIGSVFYYLTRGHEPYEDAQPSGPEVVKKLKNLEFPEVHLDDAKDQVIHKCWHGEFHSMKQLEAEQQLLNADQVDSAENVNILGVQREECQRAYPTWKPFIDQEVSRIQGLIAGGS